MSSRKFALCHEVDHVTPLGKERVKFSQSNLRILMVMTTTCDKRSDRMRQNTANQITRPFQYNNRAARNYTLRYLECCVDEHWNGEKVLCHCVVFNNCCLLIRPISWARSKSQNLRKLSLYSIRMEMVQSLQRNWVLSCARWAKTPPKQSCRTWLMK